MSREFYRGPEVPSPTLIDFTRSPKEILARRRDWVTKLDEAVRDHGAWGVLITYPDGQVELFDTRWSSLARSTRRGGIAHLLLERESRSVKPEKGRGWGTKVAAATALQKTLYLVRKVFRSQPGLQP